MDDLWRPIPQEIQQALKRRGPDPEGVLATACCDMSKEGELRNRCV